MLDLDTIDGDTELLGDDHCGPRLGAGADIRGAHIEVGAAVRVELDDHRRRRPTGVAPEARGHADASTRDALIVGPCPGVLPTKGLGAHLQTGCQLIRGERDAALGLYVVGQILQAECDGIDVEFYGEFVDHLFQRPRALREAGSAHRPSLAGVDADRRVLGAEVLTPVEIRRHRARGSAGGVRSAGSEALVVDGRQGAVVLGADLESDGVAGPVARDAEAVLAREKDLDRASGGARHQGGDDGVLSELELGAEAAAHVVTDDSDVGHWQTEVLGETLLDPVHALGAVPDREPVAVPLRDGAVGLHRSLDLTWRLEGAFDHNIRLGKSGRDIAALAHRRLADEVAALVYGRCRRLQRRRVVDDERQHLVLDFDRADGVGGLQRGFRRHRRHLLTLAPAVGVEKAAV